MELNIKDRLYIPVILPKEGTFKDLSLIHISEPTRRSV